VSRRRDPCKLINGIRDKLSHMNTNMGQDSVDQLAFWQREIRILISGLVVPKENHHPDLCQGGHASAHDPHPPSLHASCKVLSWNAQHLAYGLLIKSRSLAPPFTELANPGPTNAPRIG